MEALHINITNNCQWIRKDELKGSTLKSNQCFWKKFKRSWKCLFSRTRLSREKPKCQRRLSRGNAPHPSRDNSLSQARQTKKAEQIGSVPLSLEKGTWTYRRFFNKLLLGLALDTKAGALSGGTTAGCDAELNQRFLRVLSWPVNQRGNAKAKPYPATL